jgi:hypothetical protein
MIALLQRRSVKLAALEAVRLLLDRMVNKSQNLHVNRPRSWLVLYRNDNCRRTYKESSKSGSVLQVGRSTALGEKVGLLHVSILSSK